MTWATILALYPDRAADDANTRTLKHGFRWGVFYGAIDPQSDKAKALWASLDDGK